MKTTSLTLLLVAGHLALASCSAVDQEEVQSDGSKIRQQYTRGRIPQDGESAEMMSVSRRLTGGKMMNQGKKDPADPLEKRDVFQHQAAKEDDKPDPPKPRNRVIVKYANEEGLLDVISLGGRVFHQFKEENTIAIELDDDAIAYLDGHSTNIKSIQDDSLWVEQGYLEQHLDPSDTQVRRKLAEQIPYGISMVQADQVNIGPYDIKVCIADTGVARQHPDLLGATMTGTNRYSSADVLLRWWQDFRGHGSHVAGTISAVANNGVGVRGIGNIPLHITRSLDDQGSARESDVYEAVVDCAESGAKIISLSLGGSAMSDSFKEYITKLSTEKGLLVVGASGNNGQNVEKWPGSLPSVISVAAVDEFETRWSGSNWGEWVELSAPGQMVLSTSVDSDGKYVYSYYSGTSMATPHVAGVAALLWSYHPQCTNDQIRYALAVTAKDVNDGTEGSWEGCDEKFGHGIVQVKDALDFLNDNPCDSGIKWGEEASQGGCFADIETFNSGTEGSFQETTKADDKTTAEKVPTQEAQQAPVQQDPKTGDVAKQEESKKEKRMREKGNEQKQRQDEMDAPAKGETQIEQQKAMGGPP